MQMCVRDLPSLRIDKPHLDESAANVPARHPRYLELTSLP